MNATELFDTIIFMISSIVFGAIVALGIVTGAFKDACERGIEEFKSDWPILLGLTIIPFLPFAVSWICG